MSLTAKQEQFCKNMVKGMTQKDAYLDAYDVGIDTKTETVSRKAKELIDNGKITAHIEELRIPIEKEFKKSVHTILKEIEVLKDSTDINEKKIALDCLKEQGKILGYYVEKKQIEHSGLNEMTDEEFKERLKKVQSN